MSDPAPPAPPAPPTPPSTLNKERLVLADLTEIFSDLVLYYGEGDSEKFLRVKAGTPDENIGYPVMGFVPVGPQFTEEILGRQTLDNKGRAVVVNVHIHYEHPDEELGILRMSDILWQCVDAILTHNNTKRIGGNEQLILGEVDYAYAVQDKEKDKIPDWGYKGIAIIPVIALYRYK